MTFKFEITDDGKNKVEETKVYTKKLIRGITHIGLFSFIGNEINHIRPPKRNIGLVFNLITAAAVSEAIMQAVFPKEAAEVEVQAKEVDTEEIRPDVPEDAAN